MDAEPKLVSFVLRFVYEEMPQDTAAPGGGRPVAASWHGVIRHVQSSAERHFTRWEEAMGFIGDYVDVGQAGMQRES